MLHERNSTDEWPEPRLAALFAAYRDALPDPEPSVNFTPQLWEKIEARQVYASSVRRLARAIITAAAAASLLMGIYSTAPRTQRSVFYNNTYLELLASGQQTHDNLADVEIIAAVQESTK